VELVADDRRLPGPPARELERAAAWVARELELSGGRLPSTELERRARLARISGRTLRRARHARGVIAERARDSGQWFAVLPTDPEVSSL
jgi:hypothetical protein